MEKVIKVLESKIGEGEKVHLNGKASYHRVVNTFITDYVLCNNITDVDPDFIYNEECGFETYEELYEERLEELKEEYKEELENGDKTLEELEEEATEYAEEEQYNYEFYQYFIINISGWDLEYLKECNQKTLQICYSEKLDCYILCVGHWGTSWDYVGSDFEIEIIK